MKRLNPGVVALLGLCGFGLPLAYTEAQQAGAIIPNMAAYPDPAGVLRTFNRNGSLDLGSPFFQSLGTNGRSCGTCHQPSDAMGLAAAHVQQRFARTQGMDPIFRTNDGSNCDHNIDTSTLAGRSAAYSLLRTRGLFRIAIPVPANRDFEIVNVSNPYGCAETDVISNYRRPLPGTNLNFQSAVMWDGRESSAETGTIPIDTTNYSQALLTDLQHQALDATVGHAQGTELTTAQQAEIVTVETGLFSAQAQDKTAGDLGARGATAGPQALNPVEFHIGVNDPVGLDPANPAPWQFNPAVFNLFDAWQSSKNPQQQSIARGQTIFNTRTFAISGVAGLNGATFSNGVTGPATIISTCGFCHDTPNVGSHSIAAALNIGVADPPVARTCWIPAISL